MSMDRRFEICLHIDSQECLVSCDFLRIFCDNQILFDKSFSQYCKGRTLKDILSVNFFKALKDLGITQEEERFFLYMEYAALRASIAKYLNIDDPEFESDRCAITSVIHEPEGIRITQTILPPQELDHIYPY